jgi:hypothetical protein
MFERLLQMVVPAILCNIKHFETVEELAVTARSFAVRDSHNSLTYLQKIFKCHVSFIAQRECDATMKRQRADVDIKPYRYKYVSY